MHLVFLIFFFALTALAQIDPEYVIPKEESEHDGCRFEKWPAVVHGSMCALPWFERRRG